MTITLDEDYFAVASEPLLGYCGENESRVVEFVGLDNAQAEMYSLILSYDDGECYEALIPDGTLTLTNAMMRKAGVVDAQVYACNTLGDEYTVVKKSNILQLIIKPSIDENAQPVPTMTDCLRVLARIQQCAAELAELANRIIDEQVTLDGTQQQIAQTQQQLMTQFTSCLTQINISVETARRYAEIASRNAQQILINKSAIGLEKRNLLQIRTSGYNQDGLRMTVDADGEMTLNGSTSDLYVSIPLCSDTRFDLKKHIPNGKYILCSNGFSQLAVAVTAYGYSDGVRTERTLAYCTDGGDVEFTVDDEFEYNYVELWLDRETTFNNTPVHAMIRYSGIDNDDWEPYTADLQQQINELRALIESLPVRRPEIITGNNIRSYGSGNLTEVTQ